MNSRAALGPTGVPRELETHAWVMSGPVLGIPRAGVLQLAAGRVRFASEQKGGVLFDWSLDELQGRWLRRTLNTAVRLTATGGRFYVFFAHPLDPRTASALLRAAAVARRWRDILR